jgi:DNA-binding MarR family transcriptional regulator
MDRRKLEELFFELIRSLYLHQPYQSLTGLSMSVSEMLTLMELVGSEPLSQQMLVARLHLEKSTVSRLVKQLEQRGWVIKERDGQDTRVCLLTLSEEGRAVAEQAAKVQVERHKRVLDAMTENEQEALAGGLTGFIRVLHGIEND